MTKFRIVTVEECLANGTTPQELDNIEEWHLSLHKHDKTIDKTRHKAIAAELHRTADELRTALNQ